VWVSFQTSITKVLEGGMLTERYIILVPLFFLPFAFVSLLAIAYTGTVKLKQSWLDQFEDGNSAESKILTGNIEQAVRLNVSTPS